MRSFLSLRAFGYNPGRVLPFQDGKYKILENKDLPSFSRVSSFFLFGTTFYIGSRLVRFYPQMSWLSFLFQGSLFGLSASISKEYYKLNRMMLTSIDLMENGEEIEVQALGILGQSTLKIKIEEIEDTEENTSVRMYMNFLKSWILKTNKDFFFILPTSNVIDEELLHAILKGEKVDTNDLQIGTKDKDIIDV